jgi:ABC-type nitrate/sulfonate/bicarbonate transport system substrate-binding protein
MLRKRGLEANRDYTILETPFATMKQMLLEKKVDSAYFAQPFASDPEVNEKTKVLFTTADSMGIMMANFVVGRGVFMEKNRAVMVDFLEDYLRVVRWYFDQANRKEAIELVSQANKLPVAVLDKYLFTKKDNYRDMDGLPDLKAIQSNMQVQYDLGFTKTLINAEEYSDLSLVKEAAARLK